jgi:hypothetical protein
MKGSTFPEGSLVVEEQYEGDLALAVYARQVTYGLDSINREPI